MEDLEGNSRSMVNQGNRIVMVMSNRKDTSQKGSEEYTVSVGPNPTFTPIFLPLCPL